MTNIATFINALKLYAKAVASGLIALAAGLTIVVTGNETFADVTLAEWLVVIGFVGASYGIVYRVPNSSA